VVSEIVAAELGKEPGFRIVERRELEKLFAEMKLGTLGAVDQATAVRIGRLLGAETLCLGSLTGLGGRTLLNLRLVRTETGEVLAAASKKGKSLRRTDRLAHDAALELLRIYAARGDRR